LKAGVAPIVLGMALISSPAFAQSAPDATDAQTAPAIGTTPAAPAAGDIVVTGSRIPQPNLESASPITVVNSAEIKQTGTTRVEDLLNSLPQVFASQGSNISNGSTGTATVDLRGLGAERNLVLVNGRRLLPGDPGSAAADLNAIPAALIKRVDVLTGGASSVYGADAVAGVVNFVMDTDLQGLRVDSQYSFYQHDNRAGSDITSALNARGDGYPKGSSADGGTFDATVAFGTHFDDDRGHITAYVGYRKIQAILQAERDYSACSLTAKSTAPGYTCGGSATSANGTVIAYQGGTSTYFQVGPNQTLVPGYTPYNYGPVNYFQRPDERYTAGFFANYEISDALKPYAEFMFMDDRTVAQIAASGDFGNTFSINCDNPLLSAQQKSILCANENLLTDPAGDTVTTSGGTPYNFTDPTTGLTYNRGFAQILRRDVEGGGRQDDREHTEYRAVLGMKGNLSDVWSYDAYYQYGRTLFSETYNNDFSVTRLTRALDVVTSPTTGLPVCRSTLDGTDPNCVPYNIWTLGGVTPAAVSYLATPGFQRGINTEQVASAALTGTLGGYGIQSPWADEGVGVVAGFEYRKETLAFNSDEEFQTGDLAGQGAPTLPVSGSFDVKEAFTEVRLPIAEHSFVDSLVLTGGYRYSSYKNATGSSFSTDTYKIEGDFAPIKDIRFRAGYNRAVRAPTVNDLFSPQFVALDGSQDPCAGHVITAAEAGCIAQGLTVGQTVASNPAGQYNGLVGGNPNLLPEIADTYTAGVVLQPRFLPRFSLTVDYFNIKLRGAIGGIGADTIVSLCHNSVTPFCALIHRDQFGSLWRSANGYVDDTTQNIGGIKTSGIDVNASYSVNLGSAGSLGMSFVGTYLKDLSTDTGVGVTFDCAGLYAGQCGTPNPKWRHQARLSWTSASGIGASVRWRYFDSVAEDASAGSQPANARIPSVSYFDLALTGRFESNYNLRLGVNNIFDKSPYAVGSQACPAGPCNGNVYAQVYDVLGRYIYAGVTLNF
jgi:outer membrane receptor protein involved in Fe transport